jgi:hypothetical protein
LASCASRPPAEVSGGRTNVAPTPDHAPSPASAQRLRIAQPWAIHRLGPVYGRDRPEDELLASCYREALRIMPTPYRRGRMMAS